VPAADKGACSRKEALRQVCLACKEVVNSGSAVNDVLEYSWCHIARQRSAQSPGGSHRLGMNTAGLMGYMASGLVPEPGQMDYHILDEVYDVRKGRFAPPVCRDGLTGHDALSSVLAPLVVHPARC
jgi:hypothetical protein